MNLLEWEPLVGVGRFKLGDDIALHKNCIKRVEEEEDDETGWNVYTVPGLDIRIYEEEGKIVSIGCYESFIYKSRNLIGVDLEEVIKVFNVKPETFVDEFELHDGIQKVYEFDPISLQVWTRDGLVVTIIAYDEC